MALQRTRNDDELLHANLIMMPHFLVSKVKLYSLELLQDAQQRAYEEVMAAMDRFEGKINHESVDEMEYLEAVINESMRMWPTGNFIGRVCKKDCEVRSGCYWQCL